MLIGIRLELYRQLVMSYTEIKIPTGQQVFENILIY